MTDNWTPLPYKYSELIIAIVLLLCDCACSRLAWEKKERKNVLSRRDETHEY